MLRGKTSVGAIAAISARLGTRCSISPLMLPNSATVALVRSDTDPAFVDPRGELAKRAVCRFNP